MNWKIAVILLIAALIVALLSEDHIGKRSEKEISDRSYWW